MFELVFGIIWTAISAFCMVGVLSTGESVSQMSVPIVFVGIFVCIGIFMMFRGCRKLWKNMQTKVNGEPCYGRVLNVERNGCYVNNQPMYKAEILVYSELDCTDYTIWEDIGFDPARFPIGSFLKVLYYKGDINFTEDSYNIDDMPESRKQLLLSKSQFISSADNENIITIGGVRYIREDMIDDYKKW